MPQIQRQGWVLVCGASDPRCPCVSGTAWDFRSPTAGTYAGGMPPEESGLHGEAEDD